MIKNNNNYTINNTNNAQLATSKWFAPCLSLVASQVWFTHSAPMFETRKRKYEESAHKYAGQVVTFWLSRNIGHFTRDIHDCLVYSCSATVGTP